MLMLVDAPGLWYRSFFALPSSMRGPDGQQINAVRGFCDGLATLVRRFRPTHVACAVDNDWRPQWRVDLLPSYKAHRVAAEGGEEEPDALPPQVDIIHALLRAYGLATVGADGYEADDVLATLSAAADMPTTVVTGDRDLFQLVNDAAAVTVTYLGKGIAKAEEFDDAAVASKHGVKAEDYVAYSVLRGDPSDGLAGVPGVGEKTAAKLIHTHGDVDGVIAAASGHSNSMSPRIRSAVRDSTDYLRAAVRVVTTVADIALPPVDTTIPAAPTDSEELARLGEEYGLGSSIKRLTAALWPQE